MGEQANHGGSNKIKFYGGGGNISIDHIKKNHGGGGGHYPLHPVLLNGIVLLKVYFKRSFTCTYTEMFTFCS